MISIVGLRDWQNPATEKMETVERFQDRGWVANSVAEIFKNPDFFLQKIPKNEHFNLFYTCAHIRQAKQKGRGRQIESQNIIPFDIDHIDVNQIDETAQCACEALGIEWESTGILFSGHGLQLIVGTNEAFTDVTYFDEARPHYKELCSKVQAALDAEGFPGEMDTSVFKNTQIMRMPGTENRKKDKPPVEVRIVNAQIDYIDFNLKQLSGLPLVKPEDHIPNNLYIKGPSPDTKAVLDGCLFLKYCKKNAKTLQEPSWYAALSILGRLENGRELGHQYSQTHSGYSFDETDRKITHAIEASGPRTCQNISGLWPHCHKCEYHGGKVKSPINIKGQAYIASRDSGFFTYAKAPNGDWRYRPAYRDLKLYFEQSNKFITIEDNKLIYIYNGTHWTEIYPQKIKQFAELNFDPPADERMRKEFLHLLHVSNLMPYSWLDTSVEQKINLKNGVYDIKTGKLSEHSHKLGFRYCLPYDFDPDAKCERFERFLNEITLGRQSLINLLLEYMGYAFSGDRCWIHKALFLYGPTASNGKSTFIKTLQHLAGDNNHANQTLGGLNSDVNRYELDGKLFNVAEEAGVSSLAESDSFKRMISGNHITVKKLYSQPYSIENRCKLIVSCNELPRSGDKTEGLYRRLMIVPFQARFSGTGDDKQIQAKLDQELPGIFNLVLEGYRRLHKQQEFSGSKEVEQEMEKYKEENDNLIYWKNEKVILLPPNDPDFETTYVTKEEFYKDYKVFIGDGGQKPLSRIQFFKQLPRAIPGLTEIRKNFISKRARVILGCKIGFK